MGDGDDHHGRISSFLPGLMENPRGIRPKEVQTTPSFLYKENNAGPIILRSRDTTSQQRSKLPSSTKNPPEGDDTTQGRAAKRPPSIGHRTRDYNDDVEWMDRPRDYTQRSLQKNVLYVPESKDLTIHLELNVIEDIGPDLDEFCRLAKLGNFDAAKRFIFENLREQMNSPYVFVQYAQMLLDMGDYAAIQALRSPLGLDNITMLRMNWSLVRLLADLHIKGVSVGQVNDVITEAVKLLQTRSLKNRLGSTEVQVLSLVLCLLALRYPSADGIDVSHIFEWDTVYQHLLSEGRIWDFRDLFVSFLQHSTQETTCFQFLHVQFNSPTFIDTLVGDWLTETFDEPTSLALLDIVASLCLGPILTPEKRNIVKHCLESSRSIALSIAENDAELLRTRPYLRWSLAKARVASYSEGEISREPSLLSSLPGRFFYRSEAIDMPLYAPKQSEFID
ncbi:hypothetical protein F4803DRAFT_242104 [Xylaria telfairii]|nr:hypothetical protein F4803DRAFT_242104 [Xylaria telfairii]